MVGTMALSKNLFSVSIQLGSGDTISSLTHTVALVHWWLQALLPKKKT